ncbi:sensor histidine kinase [Homoserinimonas sp. A447]
MRSLLEFRRLTPGQLTFDVVLAVACLLLRASITIREAPMVPVVLLMAAALALRRLSPSLALSVAWLGAVTQLTFRLEPDPSNLAILPVLYATAAYGPSRTKWAGLISAGAGSVIATGYLALYPLFGSFLVDVRLDSPNAIPQFLLYTVFLFGALLATFGLSWTLGLLSRTRRTARESRIAQQLAEEEEARARQDVIVEQERNRIARDMHDVVAHSLAVVIAQADGARYAQAKDPGATVAALTTISTTAREALSDVRVLLSQLRHSQGESPQPALDDLDRLIEQLRSSGLTIARSETGTPMSLGTSQQLAIYRIVQEALTNALRHGLAEDEVQLRFEWNPDGVELTVINALNPTPAPAATAGHGLVGMRERAALVGGWLTAEPRQGLFVVSAGIPREVSE